MQPSSEHYEMNPAWLEVRSQSVTDRMMRAEASGIDARSYETVKTIGEDFGRLLRLTITSGFRDVNPAIVADLLFERGIAMMEAGKSVLQIDPESAAIRLLEGMASYALADELHRYLDEPVELGKINFNFGNAAVSINSIFGGSNVDVIRTAIAKYERALGLFEAHAQEHVEQTRHLIELQKMQLSVAKDAATASGQESTFTIDSGIRMVEDDLESGIRAKFENWDESERPREPDGLQTFFGIDPADVNAGALAREMLLLAIEQRYDAGEITEQRRNALTAVAVDLAEVLEESSKDEPYPLPIPDSDDVSARLGLKTSAQIKEEIRATQEQDAKISLAMERIAELVADVNSRAKIAEAELVVERANGALNNLLQETLIRGGINVPRFVDTSIHLSSVLPDLRSATSLDAVNEIVRDRVLPNLKVFRQTIRECHAMVVKPAMGKLLDQALATDVRFLGPDNSLAKIKPILDRHALTAAAPTTGADEAVNKWQDMLRCFLVICDLSVDEPRQRAAIVYQLGWARTLGRPVVILNSPSGQLPFDIDIQPTDITDESAIENALLDALYLPRRAQLDRRAAKRTAEELASRYAEDPDDFVRQGVKLLAGDPAGDLTAYSRVKQFLRLFPDSGLGLVTPTWPPSYSKAGQTTMFHVMPFGAGWSGKVRDAVRAAVGDSVYRRHDDVKSEHIIRSLWEEIVKASHILVDITDLNDNVLIELGISHTLGKPTKIVAQQSFNLDEQLFPLIKFWRVSTYDPENPESLGKIVRDFLAQ